MLRKLGIVSNYKYGHKLKQNFRKIKKIDFTQDTVKNITPVLSSFSYSNNWVHYHVACAAVFV